MYKVEDIEKQGYFFCLRVQMEKNKNSKTKCDNIPLFFACKIEEEEEEEGIHIYKVQDTEN
jgi:hypothetical protein